MEKTTRPTRFYSKKQENSIAKSLGGKRTPNSGATPFIKGDVLTQNFLVEAKTKTAETESFSIKRDWLDKNEEEAYAMRKYPVLAFNFGPDTPNYYVLNERMFKMLVSYLEE